MKQIFAKLLLCIWITSICGVVQSQSIPELLYYKFDGSGPAVPNLASNPPTNTGIATIIGLTQGAAGDLCGGSLIGTGNSSNGDYLNTDWAPNLSSPWTISFRTENIGASSTLFYMFGDINAGQFRCFTNGVAGPNNWILRGPFADVTAYGGAVVAPTMTTFVYDFATSDIRAYVNGVLVNTVPQSGASFSGTGPFKVGGYSTAVGLPANGYLDEFRFYSRALSAAEVAELYNPFSTPGFLGADQNFCPSTPVTLDLPFPSSSVLWNNGSSADSLVLSTSGTFSVAVSGTCGSGADTVIFTSLATMASLTQTVCDSYTAPSGGIFTTSGTFDDTIPNAVGCDSVITISLTVNNSTASTINPAACGQYASPNGSTYTASGTYTETIPNAVGCDSLITIHLEVYANSSSTITVATCGQYTAPSGTMHTSSGTFTDVIPNTFGCDSTITIHLNISQSAVTSIGINGLTLTSNALSPATYQWINCATSQAISGQTSQSFTITENGQYAVSVTNGVCVDTSSCISIANMSIAEALSAQTSVYPNPTTGVFMVQLPFQQNNAHVQIMDGAGKIIMIRQVQNVSLISLDLEAEAGLYYVQITLDSGQKITKKIFKQ